MTKNPLAILLTAGTLLTSLWLAGCGSDSDKKSASLSSAAASSIAASSVTSSLSSSLTSSPASSLSSSSAPAINLSRGQFIDSPVANLRYTTSSRTELNLFTDANGYFEFVEGDSIIFYIGDHALPSISAGAVISPLNYSAAADIHDPVVANIARLLQSLDANSDPADGISLGVLASVTGAIDFTLDTQAFANQPALIELLKAQGRTLIDIDQALDHLSDSIAVPYAISTLDCTSLVHFYCNDFSAGAEGWSLLPETENSLKPDGALAWKKISANGMLRYTAAAKGGVVALLDSAQMATVPSADYAVEARFRPRENGTTGNKQLYLILRYQDGNNWYGAALNVQNDPASTQVEIVKMLNNSISRPKQIKRPIHQGKRDANDGVWYELRAEIKGSEIRAYLDGELVAQWEDTAAAFTSAGTIGIWTANKSFEFDDVRIVDTERKPVSVTLSPNIIQYAAEAGDAPLQVGVNSTDSAGLTAPFTAVSTRPDVVAVSADSTSITLTPLAQGTANIRVTSGLDAARERTIKAEIAPQFVLSSSVYALAERTLPAPGATGVYEDQPLRIQFDTPVVLGSFGLVRIFDADSGALVDSISLQDDKDSLGVAGQTQRTINTRSIMADGNDLVIIPHAGKLAPGKNYWVAFSETLIATNSIAGKNFDGLGEVAGWKFSTRAAAPSAGLTQVVVAASGTSADFRRVQSALNYAMQNPSVETILINDGVYTEPLYLRARNNLIIRGQSRDNTIVRYANNNGLNPSTDGRALLLIAGGDLIQLENFTLHNSTLIGQGGQAETLYFNSDNGRLIARNMNFLSEQDTILVKGWSFFYQSLIAGNVDFIWGYPKAALFEKSEIRTLGDSRGNGNGGYILQARVENLSDKGFVFLNSALTRAPGPLGHAVEDGKTYLARSGGNAQYSDNIVFVNTQMDAHIAAIGWAGLGVANQPAHSPSPSTATAGWREFASRTLAGDLVSMQERQFGVAMTLAEVQAGYCSRAQVFAAFNQGEGWNPQPSDTSDCINPVAQSSSEASSAQTSSVASSAPTSSPSSSAASSIASADASSASSAAQSSAMAGNVHQVNFTQSIPQSLLVGPAATSGNTNFSATELPQSFAGLFFYSRSEGGLRYSFNNQVGAINYNGRSFNTELTADTDLSPGAVLAQFSDLTRYIAVPVTSSATGIELSLQYANASANLSPDVPNGCAAGVVIVTDQNGTVLATQSACGTASQTFRLTITQPSITRLYILMSRLTDGGGGIRISDITLTQ